MAIKKTKLKPIDTTSGGISVYEIPGINKQTLISISHKGVRN